MKHWFSDLRPFNRDPLQFFLSQAQTAIEPLVRLHLGPKPVWLVTDPDLVRHLLKADELLVDKGRFVAKLRPVVGQSTLTLNGEENRKRRAVLHSVFAKGVAQRFVPEMSAAIREAAVRASTQTEISAHAFTAPLALRMICIAMFGKDVLSRGDERAIVEAVRLVESDLADDLFRVLPLSPWKAAARRRKRDLARRMIDAVVARVRAKAGSSTAVGALVDLGLSDVEIRDEIVTMLLAGHHTTGSAAAWILYYLGTEPGLAEELAAEADWASDDAGELRAEVLPRAAKSLAFIREVLRLYPSAHWFSRDVRSDITVRNTSLKAGDALIFCPWQLHRDHNYWIAPDKFDLTRNFTGRAYLPFGAGPRVCIGMGLAQLELQLLALEMATAFSIAIKSTIPAPPPTPSVTLIPPDIRLTLEIREPREIKMPLLQEPMVANATP
jgi:cytochrome P450